LVSSLSVVSFFSVLQIEGFIRCQFWPVGCQVNQFTMAWKNWQLRRCEIWEFWVQHRSL
jgi:hypothetical protein